MRMRPKVSICIPAYKQTNFLRKCLDSILIQDYPDYEIVITDDSPDSSVYDLLQQYDFGGKLVYNKNIPALGSPQNWNAGLDLAQGEYIKILHHDDWFTGAGSLRSFVRLLDENPGADFGFSACIWVYPNEDRQKTMIPSATQLAELRRKPGSIFPENFISTPSTIIFRNTTSKLYFDKEIKWLVDSDYYFRCLLKNGNFAYADRPLVKVLIEAAHQVTSVARGNRETEIKEWIYFYYKIRNTQKFDLKNYLHLKRVFKNFNIRDEQDIRDCGVTNINKEVRSILIYHKLKGGYRELMTGGMIYSLQRRVLPQNSKRLKLARYVFSPVAKFKSSLKNLMLSSNTLLQERFDVPEVVSAVCPVVRGFEFDSCSFNYGMRIMIECEKTDHGAKAFGRWQINWLDGNNNFVFATFIPYELGNQRDHYISPLINNIPGIIKRGILYLTSNDDRQILVHSYSFSLYSIRNAPIRKLLHLKSGSKPLEVKVKTSRDQKNVLFIIPWMSVGGGDMVNLTIMRYIAKHDYNVHIFTSEQSKNEWKSRFEVITKNIVVLPSVIKNAQSQYEYTDYLVQYIRAANVETLIVSNSEFGYGCLPVLKNEFPGLKIVDILHGQGGEKEGGGFPEYSKSFDSYLDQRITINFYLKNYLMDKYGISPEKIKVIPNCIDTVTFTRKRTDQSNTFIITYIGRLSYEKHPETVIAIAEVFRSQYPSANVMFQIVGDGPMYNDLKVTIREKGLNACVQLKGYTDQIREVLNQTDVLVLCSEMEGLPIVLLEAMAMSVPCIASNVGGIPELIDDGVNGYLVDYNEGNVKYFMERIAMLYHNTELRREFSINARKKIERQYSIASMIQGYLEVLGR